MIHRRESQLNHPVTVDVGHVVVTDPTTGAVSCTCGRFAAPAASDSEVAAHLATHDECLD